MEAYLSKLSGGCKGKTGIFFAALPSCEVLRRAWPAPAANPVREAPPAARIAPENPNRAPDFILWQWLGAAVRPNLPVSIRHQFAPGRSPEPVYLVRSANVVLTTG